MLCPGQVYRTTVTVKDQDTAPSTATLTITKLADSTSEQHTGPWSWTAAGRDYTTYYDYTLPAAGQYRFTWVTQGPGTAPVPDYVHVGEYLSVISLAEAREFLGAQGATTDAQLQNLADAATRLAETVTGTLVTRVFTDIIPGDSAQVLRLPHGPLPAANAVTSVTSLLDNTVTWATADLVADTATGRVYRAGGQPFYGGPWTAVYTGGRATISGLAIQGVKEILWDLYATVRGLTTDSDSPDLAEVAAFEASMAGATGYRIPPRALAYLNTERAVVPGFA